MSDIAIDIKDLSKIFRVYPDLTRSRIKQALFPWKTYYQEKLALQDVNLTIKKGEVVGVLGPNGAGKTTLLKIIAGISRPTGGNVRSQGRVFTVLALGLGFHPRLSGRENVMLAGLMLGMTKREVRERMNWIVEFSEIGEYIDRPMTSYSSGMKARLSFAIASAQIPDVLIIDEALATGDIRFVQKCLQRIQEIVSCGTTALFVSHNIWSIKRLAKRSILLDHGKIIHDGDTHRVADLYYEAMLSKDSPGLSNSEAVGSKFIGTGEVQLTAIELLDQSGKSVTTVQSGEPVSIVLNLVASTPISGVSFSLQCHRFDGVRAFINGAMAGGVPDENGKFGETRLDLKAGVNRVVVQYPSLLLAPGNFYLSLQIFDADAFSGYTSSEQYYYKSHVLEFSVQRIRNPNFGYLYYQPARIFPEDLARDK